MLRNDASMSIDYVSCAPATIYRDGGFYEGGSRLEQLCAAYGPMRDRLHAVAEIYPPFSYQRKPICAVRADDGGFVRALQNHDAHVDSVFRRGAAALLVRIDGCLVNSDILYVKDGARRPILWETHRPNDRAAVVALSADELAALQPASAALPLHAGQAVYLYVGSAGSRNYGHWLVDDFPRLRGARLIAHAAARRLVVVMTSWGDAIDRAREDCVRLALGPEAAILWLLPRITYSFHELHYVTPTSFHPALKSPQALDFAAAVSTPPSPVDGAAAARIFVTRGPARTRTLINNDAIEEFLHSFGFVTIDVEAMDVADQIRAFYGAKLVVGVMGAAMTNTLFCAPRTRVIHLAPQGWTEPFFWDLAAVRGQVYAACFGRGDEAIPAPLRPFSIADRMLGELLEALEN
jgi:capsular polysaccharide biosynthesis protein